MTTAPRALTSETDELAATISVLKSRLNELETASGSGNAPIGTIVDYIGTTEPAGWTVLDGGTITNGALLYPNLWAILPSSFKSGNNIVKPDTRGKVTVHRSASGTLDVAVGSTGGAETVTLTTAQLPSHAHTIAHDHTYSRRSYGISSTSSTFAGGANGALTSVTITPTDATLTTSAASNANSGNEGSGDAHTNLQPYMVTVKIMKLR